MTNFIPRQPRFQAIIIDNDSIISSPQFISEESAKDYMNSLMDDFKYADNNTKVTCDAKYNRSEFLATNYAKEHPNALALRVFSVREYGRKRDSYYKIIGKVVMS